MGYYKDGKPQTAKQRLKDTLKETELFNDDFDITKVDTSETINAGNKNNKHPMVINSPHNVEVVKSEMSKIVEENVQWSRYGQQPDGRRNPYGRKFNTGAELDAALHEFWTRIGQRCEYPTVEKVQLWLGGISRQTLNNWRNGERGQEIQEIIQETMLILAGVDGQLASQGFMNYITYIYRSKNFYGMVDKIEYAVDLSNKLGDISSAEAIEKRITEGVVVDDEGK